ncbi:hypothetical protein HZU77_016640 [Neisseriaceae bacterium TC5R-5]|nr:hypothetical protein [Neisseriaceae bacterium TC5R-5]
MATIAEWLSRFADERPVGTVLDEATVLAQALAACRLYAGYAALQNQSGEISADTLISDAEWALIRPLFLLYIERENALHLEASRTLGVDVYGRSSSEIANDILQQEAELPHRAFCQPIITV